MAGRKTSEKAAQAASRVLADKESTADEKTVAASALAQVEPVKDSPLSAETIRLCETELRKAVKQYASKGIKIETPDGTAFITVDKGKGFAEVVTPDGVYEAARI